MKNKSIFILFAISLVLVGFLLAQNKTELKIDSLWKNVNEFAEKQLPESALKDVNKIMELAQKENNTVQFIKASVYKMRLTLEKNPDAATQLVREFESIAKSSKSQVDKALLNSMSAELFSMLYQNNAWTVNRRTELKGLVPDDIKEWTKNNYIDKITQLLQVSTSNDSLLKTIPASQYADLMTVGTDSKNLQPTLFDFLIYRKIEILTNLSSNSNNDNQFGQVESLLPAKEFIQFKVDSISEQSIQNEIIKSYQQLLQMRLNDANIPALIYADLKRLEYFHNNNNLANADELYLKSLDNLIDNYRADESVIDVYVLKANYYLNNYSEKVENKDYKKIAYKICTEGIELHPDYKHIGLLKNIRESILQKTININYPQIAKPNNQLKVNIQSANVDTLQIKVYKVNTSAVDYCLYKQNSRGQKMIHPSSVCIDTKLIIVKKNGAFINDETDFQLQTKDFGLYEFTVSTPKSSEFSLGSFTVTDLAFIYRANNPLKGEIYVLNRISGQPIPNVQVKVLEQSWLGSGYDLKQKQQLITDGNGLCNYGLSKKFDNNVYFFEKGNDRYFSSTFYSYYSNPTQNEVEKPKLQLFTDRSLYRPGQSVYFKGVAYYSSKNKQEVIKNANYELTLLDANFQKISTKNLKTNEFGSFAGEFVLPQTGLNGAYQIKAENTSISIWVEEYKRPTFEVKVDMPKAEIRFGEMAVLTANVKAYAGYSVANAKVAYRIQRSVFRYCWWYSEPDKIVSTGETISDIDGNFSVTFIPEKTGRTSNIARGEFYTYSLITDVTDPKGETQQGKKDFSVGEKSLFILANVPEKIDKKSEVKLDISVETLNGETIHKTIDYEVYSLKELTDFIENISNDTILKTNEKVLSGKWNSENKNLTLDVKKWKSAQYKIVFKTQDAWGNEVKTEKIFVLYGNDDKRPPIKTYEWFQSMNMTCEVGEKATIRYGTSTQNSLVLYELMQGNQVLYSKWIKFSNDIKTFIIPFKESYQGGINVRFTFMKDEKLFTQTFQITRKVEIKKLSPKLTVFRDKLKPGEKAEWTVNIPESSEKNKVSELLIGMYDASLDAIRTHSWSFYPVYRQPILHSPEWSSNRIALESDAIQLPISYIDNQEIQLNTLNWFGLGLSNYQYYRRIMIRGSSRISASQPMAKMENDEVVVMGSVAEKKSDMTGSVSKVEINDNENLVFQSNIGVAESQVLKPVHIRSNFNETAFFYPQLRTDAEGNVKVSFTVPESVTRWNVKMLAHTTDLYFGQSENQVLTQKELMVQMNLPRFVRRSDKPIISATVTNLTDSILITNVEFQLIDPVTDKVIFSKMSSPISLGKASEQVSFELDNLSAYELLICKVVARTDNFSDGEQKYLPILPDKVLVTESMALNIRNNETRNYSFESLLKNFSKVETKQLSVEFSSNPAWYAVQALPTLSAPETDNALDLMTAYYVNSLAAYIANVNPKISKVFDQWKNAGGSRDALLSNLEKNAELKNMLLEETPWVMAAQDETEQKRQIALLFDLNQQKNQSQQYLDKLLKLQAQTGGFAWFDGMPESRYITQEILLNLARLTKLTAKSVTTNDLQKTINQAFVYLDKEISKDFDQLKKYNKNYQNENCVNDNQLLYLYLRSEYPKAPVAEFAKDAIKFYTEQTEKYWTKFSLYSKAKVAILSFRNGNKTLPQLILKSLKENALKTDEFGMYWAKNKSGYFWNERPITVQAAILEAFVEIYGTSSDIDEMKIWLLKQKQTQRWDSRISTVDAIYALLLQGSNWLAEGSTVKIKIGTTELKPKSTEAGTGYFKETIPAADVRKEMGNVTVTSTNTNSKSGIGWGAMYWQYFQDLDKVIGQSGALKVSKKLFIEKVSTSGKMMLPIEQAQLKKGDKVITRLVITTDRDLEFVALKDLRAACFEPVNQRSGCEWKEGVCYYQTTKDASTQFFFSNLPKGTYVFEYEMWVNNSGEFSSGMATVQCQYAPEFVSHTGGEKIKIAP